MMQVNLSAPVMLAKTRVAASEGKRPAIVHIVDQRVVHQVPDPIAYSLYKSALWQATATLAVAFGSRASVTDVAPRSERRRVGKEGGSTCRSRWGRDH